MTADGGQRFHGPHGPRDYLDLPQSPAATAEELRWLAESPYSFVRLAVARHPSTPTDVLDRLLARDPENTWLREVVGDDRGILERARRAMGPESLALSREIEAFWGREPS